MKRLRFLTVAFTLCLLFSCGEKAFILQFKDVPTGNWNYSDTLSFALTDKSTSAQKPLKVVIRNTDQYAFQNIWIDVFHYQDGQRVDSIREEILLADPTGRWVGKKSGALYTTEHELDLSNTLSGKDDIQIIQVMRQNPLNGVQSVGLKVD